MNVCHSSVQLSIRLFIYRPIFIYLFIYLHNDSTAYWPGTKKLKVKKKTHDDANDDDNNNNNNNDNNNK